MVREVIVFNKKLLDIRSTNENEVITHILLSKNKALKLALALFNWGSGELD